MNYTLKQLQERVNKLIEQQGEDAECGAVYDLGRDKGHAEMLELAVEWLQNCDLPHSLSYSNEYRSDRHLVVNAFKKAMRLHENN